MNKSAIRKRRRSFTRQFYKGNTSAFAVAVLETIIMVGANLMISWLMQKLIDVTTGTDTEFTLLQVTGLCVVCIAIFTFGMWLAYLSKPRFIAKAIGQYKEFVFQKISQKGISAFSGENTSFYISALSNDANTIETDYLANIFLLIDDILLFIGAFGLMLWYSPLLTAIGIALALLPVVASVLAGNRVAEAEKKVSEKNESYTGSICYDEAELRQISSESLYEKVSVVQQNVFIFNASIRDNITMFSDFPREEVNRAIELSGLSKLIVERGEDYLCGENGSGLSGGEKQRISIARSLLKKSRVLLVDEATAALDAQTAFLVSNAILDLNDLTRIVVTHALDENLLKRYDCVLTLKNSNITESGSFDELMEKKGYFYSLFTVSL